MTKREYLKRLRRAMRGVPQREVESLVDYYSELIDDAYERGKTTKQVFQDLSAPEEAAEQYLRESGVPIGSGREYTRKREKKSVWLLPLRILLAIFAVALGIAGVVVLVVFAVVGTALVVAGSMAVVMSVGLMIGGHVASAFAQIGMGIAMSGCGVLLIALSPFIWKLTMKIWRFVCGKPQKEQPVRRWTVRTLAVGGGILLLGGLMFTASFGALGFRYESLAVFDDVVTREQTVEGEFTDILLRADNFGVKVERGEGEELKVIYRETEDLPRSFTAENGELSLKTYEKEGRYFPYWVRASWEHGIFFNSVAKDLNEATLVLPASFAGGLTLETHNGAVYIAEQDLSELKITVHNGAVWLEKVTAEKMSVETHNGALGLKGVTAETISLITHNGAVALQETRADKLTLETHNGAVTLKKLAGDDIQIKVGNGAVTGSILGDVNDYRIDAHTGAGTCNLHNKWEGSKSLTVNVSNGTINVKFE